MTLRLAGSTSGYTEIDAPAVAGSNTLVLPTGNGSSGQVLSTNGSGALSWTSSVMLASGSAASPSLYISGSTGSGMWSPAADTLAWSTGGTERMRISSAGGVFVNGATSPVSGNPNDGIHTGSGGGHLGDSGLTLGDGIASARWRLVTGGYHLNFYQNNGSGTYVSRAYVTNSTGAYVAVSDQRAKKDIVDADYGIDTLKQLRPVSYLMKDQDETTARRNLGFIAQEVLGVVPEAVNVPADPEQMYGLESSALIPVIVSSLQQAVAKIESLEAANADLAARLTALEVTP